MQSNALKNDSGSNSGVHICASLHVAVFAMGMLLAPGVSSLAFAGTCDNVTGHAAMATCVAQELQREVERLDAEYKQLSATLGPDAADEMLEEQLQWLDRVADYCGISRGGTLESQAGDDLVISRTLCSKHFVEARTTELIGRRHRASEIADAFSNTDSHR